MRTTLAIDDDVLAAAKAIACQSNQTLGEVVSELARQSWPRRLPRESETVCRLLPVRRPDAIATLEIVNALRDELP